MNCFTFRTIAAGRYTFLHSRKEGRLESIVMQDGDAWGLTCGMRRRRQPVRAARYLR
jgi:hypothetical protein